MNNIAIRCEGLSKQYRIGEQERYKALRDVLTDAAASPFRRLRSVIGSGNGSSIRNPNSEIPNSFWALDDVSFEVKCGDVLAAGKFEKTLRHDREGLPKMACHASGPCVILRGAYL